MKKKECFKISLNLKWTLKITFVNLHKMLIFIIYSISTKLLIFYILINSLFNLKNKKSIKR